MYFLSVCRVRDRLNHFSGSDILIWGLLVGLVMGIGQNIVAGFVVSGLVLAGLALIAHNIFYSSY